MPNLQQIAAEIYNRKQSTTHRELVANIERNWTAIQSAEHQANRAEHDVYCQLMADYGIALAEIQDYRKALPQIATALKLFENNPNLNNRLPDLKFYESLLFQQGLCHFYQGNPAMALPVFEQLVKLYPQNSLYQTWVNAIHERKWRRWKIASWYLLAVAVIGMSIFDEPSLYKNASIALGIVALVGGLALDGVIFYRKKKLNQHAY